MVLSGWPQRFYFYRFATPLNEGLRISRRFLLRSVSFTSSPLSLENLDRLKGGFVIMAPNGLEVSPERYEIERVRKCERKETSDR